MASERAIEERQGDGWILAPHRATRADLVLWLGLLLVTLAGASALFGTTIHDLVFAGDRAATSAPQANPSQR